jgi:uncharacterized protein (TIGR03437 family)
VGKAGLLRGVQTQPVKPGDTILFFGTGFGSTTPIRTSGELVDQPAPLASSASVQIGGVPATVQFAGLVGPGLYQLNVVIPELPDGDQPLRIEVAGVRSQQNVFVTVQR